MYIHKILKKEDEQEVKIECDIEIETKQEKCRIWLTAPKMYSEYICTERADAFVILLLPLAMLLDENIICELPVTADIMYQINKDMIPVLARNSKQFNEIKISAVMGKALDNDKKVGTGCSGGIDSLYTILDNLETGYKGFDLTHICVFNNLTCSSKRKVMFDELIKKASMISKDLKLSLLIADSNCMKFLPVPEDYNFLNTYAILFYVLTFQKLFGRYYLASNGKDYADFSVKDADKSDCTYYDLLTLKSCSTEKMKLISSGGALLREEKTRAIAEWEVAQKYLKVCNENEENCGRCGKCKRTLFCLEVLGVLDKFKNVFNVEEFRKNKRENYYWLFKRHCIGDKFIEMAFDALKEHDLMQEIVRQDQVWKYLKYAEGPYDDGWIQGKFYAISNKCQEHNFMCIQIYVSQLTPENTVTIFVNDKLVLKKRVVEGVWQIKVPLPCEKEFKWKIECDTYVVPKESNLSEDIRELACILEKIEFVKE